VCSWPGPRRMQRWEATRLANARARRWKRYLMTNSQPLVMTTVVTSGAWVARHVDVLRIAHAVLHEQISNRGSFTLEHPQELVELLSGGTRVRVSLSVDAVTGTSNL
jgi:hypothetical protein